MCDENLLYSTKAILKYLINNNGFYQTVDTIDLSFYNYAKVTIPFYDLGYNSLLTFLQNIPDILEVDFRTFAVRPSTTHHQSILPYTSSITSHQLNYSPLQWDLFKPKLFPRVLPWNPPIKEPESITDDLVASTSFPLEPRSYGDGKCSSHETLSTDMDDQDQIVTSTFAKISMMDDFKLVPGNLELDKDAELNFEESTPLPYSENQNQSIELEIDRLDSFDYDSDSNLSSPEDKPMDASCDSAILFANSELDETILMLNSQFFNKNYGARYETTNIDDLMEVGSVYEIYVSEVNNPYKFWFRLADDPNPVDELQEQLNSCYTSGDRVPDVIKKEHLRRGYACAALYFKIWHRGEIQGQPIDDKVCIYFVDYGTVDQVSIADVRYLFISFSCTPKLCHRGTLDFVKPINCRWNVKTTTFFLGLVTDRKLIAGVSEIDHKTNSVRIYLMDSANSVNINRMMVLEGYAFPDDPRDRCCRHIADVQPSFDALEMGDCVTFSEIATLMAEHNYDYEKLILNTTIDEASDCFIPPYYSQAETLQRMEDFQNQREEEKQVAQRRDRKMFLQFFENILNNPFFNGIITEEIEEKDSKPNPFLD